MSEKLRHVVVIGAGVTGLTSALFLVEAGYKVTIIAAHVPGDESIEYSSPWAGAHWNTGATPEQTMLCDWDIQTYNDWAAILEKEQADPRLPKSGLKMQDSYHFYHSRPATELWWAPYVKGFRQANDTLDPVASINRNLPTDVAPIKWAIVSRLPSLNVPQYLLWLREKGRVLGVEIIQARLPINGGLDEVLIAAEKAAEANGRGSVDCFVNATGLSAGRICGDEAVHPIRGQTVLVKGEAVATRTLHGDEYTYCIPRPGTGTTVLGGVKEVGSWSEKADDETTRKILERNTPLVPELLTAPDGGFEVISVQVGLRPGREGGPRMEKETVGGRKVVHAYGHGSGGYQNSAGSARLVVKMVTESTGGSHVFARL